MVGECRRASKTEPWPAPKAPRSVGTDTSNPPQTYSVLQPPFLGFTIRFLPCYDGAKLQAGARGLRGSTCQSLRSFLGGKRPRVKAARDRLGPSMTFPTDPPAFLEAMMHF